MALLKRGGLRLVDTLTFVAGARQTSRIEVPARFMQRLWVWLRGTLTVTVVTTPGTVHNDGPANLIQQLELLVDGKTVKIGSGAAFLRIGQQFDQTDGVNNGILSGALGVYPFQALIPLCFEAPSTVSPIDTLLDGRLVKNMILNLTWGTTASLVIGNTSTLAVAATAEIVMQDTEPFATVAPFWTMRESETTFTNIATAGQTRLQLPFTPGAIIRSIQLRAIDANAGNNPLQNIINTLSLRVNGEEFPLNQVQDEFTQAIARQVFGRDQTAVGYYHLEMSENGRVASTGLGAKLEGQAVKDIDIILNTTTGGGGAALTQIVAHLVEHVPPEIMGVGTR